jgi:hypothetical protein
VLRAHCRRKTATIATKLMNTYLLRFTMAFHLMAQIAAP